MTGKFEGGSRVHLALNTAQFEESVQFYTALFALPPSKLKPGYAKFEPSDPPVNLTLNQANAVTGNRVNHFGIEVRLAGDVQLQTERLNRLGLETLNEDSTLCCYAVQDKVWVRDPDGNAWETFVVFSDSEQKQEADRSSVCCAPDGGEDAESARCF